MDAIFFMQAAYKEAQKAYEENEVPIGAVLVRDNIIIARGYNKRNGRKNALCHAEIAVIDQGCRITGDWRLEECTLFVTVEPCPMCAGAILQARIPVVYFGAYNGKAGCAGSVCNLLQEPRFNHQVDVRQGLMETECSELMRLFFKRFRK